MLRYISARTRSATPFTTSAPSCAGSMCTRNRRLPKGKSTTLTIALATSATSASAGAVAANPLHDVLTKMRVRAVVVLGLTRLVCWCTSMGEVIRAGGEGSGNDDRGLDAPAVQLCGIADSERIHSC